MHITCCIPVSFYALYFIVATAYISDYPIVMNITIRQRKHARTKLSILHALLARIESSSLESISIKDLCQDANIAQATFFLYFQHKASILDYFIQLWGAEITWQSQQRGDGERGLAVIERIFDYAGMRAEQRPMLMAEVVSYAARRREIESSPPLSSAELGFAFPEYHDIDKITPQDLVSIFSSHLKEAVAHGELPTFCDLDSALPTLLAIFFSTPILSASSKDGDVRSHYRRQLRLVWSALRNER